jgi:hypothetical protein
VKFNCPRGIKASNSREFPSHVNQFASSADTGISRQAIGFTNQFDPPITASGPISEKFPSEFATGREMGAK